MADDRAKGAPQRERDAVDRAINRVLQAEAEAREAVAQCRERAESILAQADTECREITRRAEARLQLTQRIADRGIARALDELRAPLTSPQASRPQAADVRIDEVAAVLSRELIAFAPPERPSGPGADAGAGADAEPAARAQAPQP